MLAATAFLIWCAVTVTGGGFLDLSNIVRYVLTSMAVISGVIALILAKVGWKNEKPASGNCFDLNWDTACNLHHH